MEIRKPAYSQIKNKFQSAIPALKTCSFFGVNNYEVKGQVTGTFTKVLGTTDHYLLSVNLYDDKYRVIRTYSDNYLGGNDITLTKYDFIGNVLKTKQIHYKDADATTPVVVNQRMIYDHASRLKEVYHQINDNPEILMVAYEYNELGEVIKEKLNQNADGSFLQEIDYEYNIRGWRTKINDPNNLGNDKFAMELFYNDVIPEVNNTGDEQYNGNVAAIKWNTPEFGVKAYGYGYDNINRLERAKFAAGTALNTDVDKYSVENITYDANGNILTLGRHNTAAGYIDNLTMTYDGNQLKKTHDSGDLVQGFVDMVDYETEYHYDFNGNMDIDDNKGFTFAYNHLNLAKEIVGGNDTVRYVYNARGTKLSKELAQSGAISYTDYIGNFVYKDGDLDYILTSEGRITEPVSGTIQYEYFLKDHLGNTRAVFADGNSDGLLADNEVLQENHYYPFGMNIGDLAVDRGIDNKLKYNGKELQDDALNGVQLNYYAYGWRDYDPIVPHFNTIDPLAEYHFDVNPYHYCLNNPILYIDPFGLDTTTVVGDDGTPVFDMDEVVVTGKRPGWLKRVLKKIGNALRAADDALRGDNEDYSETEVEDGVDMDWWESPEGNGDRNVIDGDNENFEDIFGETESVKPPSTTGTTDTKTKQNNQTSDKEIVEKNTGSGPRTNSQGRPIEESNTEYPDTTWYVEYATTNETDSTVSVDGKNFESGDSIIFWNSTPRGKGKVTKKR